jgi:hypothetical protein
MTVSLPWSSPIPFGRFCVCSQHQQAAPSAEMLKQKCSGAFSQNVFLEAGRKRLKREIE